MTKMRSATKLKVHRLSALAVLVGGIFGTAYQKSEDQAIWNMKPKTDLRGWRVEIKTHSDNCRTYTVARMKLTLLSVLLSPKLAAFLIPLLAWCYIAADSTHLFVTKEIALVYFLAVVFCLRCYQSYHVHQESVLVVRTYGVQVTTEYSTGAKTHQFYPSTTIHSIIINEGISMHQVFYYMALMLKEGDELTKLCPLFMKSTPSLSVLRLLYTDMNNTFVYPPHPPA